MIIERLTSLVVESDLLTVTCLACGGQTVVELANGRSTPQPTHAAGCPVVALGVALGAGAHADAARLLADAVDLAAAGGKPKA